MRCVPAACACPRYCWRLSRGNRGVSPEPPGTPGQNRQLNLRTSRVSEQSGLQPPYKAGQRGEQQLAEVAGDRGGRGGPSPRRAARCGDHAADREGTHQGDLRDPRSTRAPRSQRTCTPWWPRNWPKRRRRRAPPSCRAGTAETRHDLSCHQCATRRRNDPQQRNWAPTRYARTLR